MESPNAVCRLTDDLFLPGRSFFRSLRTFGKPRLLRAWFFTTSIDSSTLSSRSLVHAFSWSAISQPCNIAYLCGVGAPHLELPESNMPSVGIHPDGPVQLPALTPEFRPVTPSSAAARRVPAWTAVMTPRLDTSGVARVPRPVLQVQLTHSDPTSKFSSKVS